MALLQTIPFKKQDEIQKEKQLKKVTNIWKVYVRKRLPNELTIFESKIGVWKVHANAYESIKKLKQRIFLSKKTPKLGKLSKKS